MHCTKIGLLRSVQGQKRKSWPSSGTSVLPPIKDMQRPLRHVGFVLPAQPVDATLALNLCWGFEFRGLGCSLSWRAACYPLTAARPSSVDD